MTSFALLCSQTMDGCGINRIQIHKLQGIGRTLLYCTTQEPPIFNPLPFFLQLQNEQIELGLEPQDDKLEELHYRRKNQLKDEDEDELELRMEDIEHAGGRV